MKNKLLTTILFILTPFLLIAQENNSILCSDGIDNDGDGLIDCLDSECSNLPNNGCQTCLNDGLSFADYVIIYEPMCSLSHHTNPQAALGVSDFDAIPNDGHVTLGGEGSITLGFNDNLIVNSGDNNSDVRVFEVGRMVEPSKIDLRPFNQNTIDILNDVGVMDSDSDGFFEFGIIAGATSSIDIDSYVSGYSFSELKFDAIKITDINGGCAGDAPGADIDAVCALSSIKINCDGVPNGTAIVDECGECLELTDPNFNQSCADCDGIPNGTAVIDDCGECIESTDPNFNQSCADCDGIPNGTAVVDDCGECLESTDPNFNQSCADCNGVPNGTAIVDYCGECLEPTDPNFNQSCPDKNNVYIPNVFSPNDDGINDRFQVFKNPKTEAKVMSYLIFNRWGGLMYKQNNLEFTPTIEWWNGTFKGKKAGIGVYVYFIEIEFQNGEIRQYEGDVSIVK